MMCISLFSYGRPVVVRCKGVQLDMGWVGSWVHKFSWEWVGLGWVGSVIWWVGLGWVDENRPTDNSGISPFISETVRDSRWLLWNVNRKSWVPDWMV